MKSHPGLLAFFAKLKLSYGTFWLAISVLYALAIVAPEFSGIPAGNLRGAGRIFLQWLMVSAFASAVLGIISSSRYLFAILFPLLSVAGAANVFFYTTVGMALNGTAIEIALGNDSTMWLSVISPLLVICVIVALVISVLAVLIRWHCVRFKADNRGMLAVFILAALLPFQVSKLGSFVGSRMPYTLWFSTEDYIRNRQQLSEVRDTYANTAVELATDSAPDVILVIGEALRADHLDINGYNRITMPKMGHDTALISMSDVISGATHTYASLPRLFTRADSTSIERAYNEESFITLFKRAGYRTSWFANQDLSASYVFFAHEADTLSHVNSSRSLYSYGQWLDTDLLAPLNRWLDNGDKRPALAVLHTIGSHWWYKAHYTDDQAVFLPDIDSKELSSLTDEQLINSYDNTIIATDDFLYRLTDSLRGRNAIVIYISDHGEALGENGVWLHGSDVEPLHRPAQLLWYTGSYLENFPDKIEAARLNKDKRLYSDDFFHTVLDAADIRTEPLKRDKSLFYHD